MNQLREEGNDFFRRGLWQEAVERYSRALKSTPRDEVLLSNRSAAYAKLGQFDKALMDAKDVISIAPKWHKGYSRMGGALQGLNHVEQAYTVLSVGMMRCSEHARDLASLRVPLVDRLLRWDTAQARAREERFARVDAHRLRSSLRIFCISDLHVDTRSNIKWCHGLSTTEYQNDILLVPVYGDPLLVFLLMKSKCSSGDVADTAAAVRSALKDLKSKFHRVFYLPGNHDLWIRTGPEQSHFPDSVCKLLGLLEMCDELGVETAPAEIASGVFVVPLFSWYSYTFDEAHPAPGAMRFDKFCKWPFKESDMWQFMLGMNKTRVRQYKRKPDDMVFTMSHFLPRTELPFSPWVDELAKAIGCKELDAQLRNVQSDVHIYGHSHINCDMLLGGSSAQNSSGREVRYVQYALDAVGHKALPMCLWDKGESGAGKCIGR